MFRNYSCAFPQLTLKKYEIALFVWVIVSTKPFFFCSPTVSNSSPNVWKLVWKRSSQTSSRYILFHPDSLQPQLKPICILCNASLETCPWSCVWVCGGVCGGVRVCVYVYVFFSCRVFFFVVLLNSRHLLVLGQIPLSLFLHPPENFMSQWNNFKCLPNTWPLW